MKTELIVLFAFVSWIFIMWIIWKARKEAEKLDYKKKK